LEIDSVWYAPTSFRRYDETGEVVETYKSEVTGRGMHFEAAELERRVRDGITPGSVLPASETLAIMRCLDDIRAQIGLSYPGEREPAS
jgi:hypothetical protein